MHSFIMSSLLKQHDVYSELHFQSKVRSRPVLEVLRILTKTRPGTYLVLLETFERFYVPKLVTSSYNHRSGCSLAVRRPK